MPPLSPPQAHTRSIIAGVLLLLVVLCASVLYLRPSFIRDVLPGSSSKELSTHGALYLTLQAGGLRVPYTLDPDAGTLSIGTTAGSDGLLESTLSPDGNTRVYLCKEGNGPVQICMSQQAVRNHIQLTQSAHESKRGLRWSRDNAHILFTARISKSSEDKPYNPDDWGVFMVGLQDGKEHFIATGTSPFFSPDSRTVYYLRANGMHGTVLQSGETALVWPLEGGEAHRFMALAVSPSGSHIAWTNALADGWKGNLSLFEVKSWHPFSMAQKARITLPAMQVVFSPDSGSLAFNTAPDPASGEAPAIYVLKLDGEPERIFNLQAYDRETVISDWR